MKHVGLLCATLLACSIPCYAADVDISGMDLGQLMELREQIDLAIGELSGADVITNGNYSAGTAIKVGSYKFTACKTEDPDDDEVLIQLWKEDSFDNILTSHLTIGSSTTISIPEGALLQLFYGDCFIEPAEANSWAP